MTTTLDMLNEDQAVDSYTITYDVARRHYEVNIYYVNESYGYSTYFFHTRNEVDRFIGKEI